jgi:hypothetical protein
MSGATLRIILLFMIFIKIFIQKKKKKFPPKKIRAKESLKESKGIRIKECGLGEECQAQRGVSSTKRSVKHKEECQA